MATHARFAVGQVVHHLKFDYRGVIIDVDADFQGSDDWYERVAQSRPPRDQPWYHVLVENAEHMTYVAERHLEKDPSGEPINHPAIVDMFDDFKNGVYQSRRGTN